MDINFFEPADVPQPRDKVKIERFEAKPYPDGWRIRLIVDVTPFQERPSLEIRVQTGDEDQKRRVAELSVIETMTRHMEFTVHIRGVPSPVGQYLAEAELYYENVDAPQDRRAVPFTVEAGA
jgi:hypothetical protein